MILHSFVDTGERNVRGGIYYRCINCEVWDLVEVGEPIKPPEFQFQYFLTEPPHNGKWVSVSCEESILLRIHEEI
jgi:hypothetical protein